MMQGAQKAKYTEKQSAGADYFTAGIDLPIADAFGKPTFHYNAIEVHGKTAEEADRMRDFILESINYVNAAIRELK